VVKLWSEESQSLVCDTYNLSKKKIVSYFLPSLTIMTLNSARRKGLPQGHSSLSLSKQYPRRK
jgi:hypothetical protein